VIELRFADGQLAALARHKLAWPTPTHPVVQDSALLRSRETPTTPPAEQEALSPPTTPNSVAQIFSAHEQGKTRLEPRRKLSAEGLCTTCRREKHYGSCSAPKKIPTKVADFNLNMHGNDPSTGDNPSTSPHYHSATSDSALARARDGRPSDEQAATGFADLFRHLGVTSVADEPGRMYGGLNKTSRAHKLADFMLAGSGGHSMHEQRGPSPNPYEERLTIKSPPVGWGDEGPQRTRRAFDQIDGAVDTTSVGGGFGDPQPGPAALG
jgi:hypothetical protein